jgi:aspartyl-tRNA(Asn)/glutamyl-tRNA(Gln) amidotransferase subunit C
MTIDTATVARIAHLARLKVPDEQLQHVAGELSTIMNWVEQLNEVNVDGIEPLANVNDLPLRARDDIVTDGNCPDDILANAPSTTAGFFVVPKVVE